MRSDQTAKSEYRREAGKDDELKLELEWNSFIRGAEIAASFDLSAKRSRETYNLKPLFCVWAPL
jgi:hypothetical protein